MAVHWGGKGLGHMSPKTSATSSGGGGGGGSTAALKFNVAGNSQYAPVVAL